MEKKILFSIAVMAIGVTLFYNDFLDLVLPFDKVLVSTKWLEARILPEKEIETRKPIEKVLQNIKPCQMALDSREGLIVVDAPKGCHYDIHPVTVEERVFDSFWLASKKYCCRVTERRILFPNAG
ncbi:hypothetical protein HYT00_00170 [Candidatus Giovannonibacteria bacterium]|nr:hypothetical protein [Candidatus Giovannonibacteria bacterium]